MAQVKDNEAKAFLQALEEKRGGSLAWRTFSTFYSDSEGNIREHGVFLYEVNNHFWYEDFEHAPQLFGIPIPKPRNAEPYIKFEADFGPEDVKSIRQVKKSAALSFCKGTKKYEKLKSANLFDRLFSQCVTEFVLKNGTVLFLELIDNTLKNKIENTRS